jgi:hypothetical protein
MHPVGAAEHLSPLIVCAGAAGDVGSGNGTGSGNGEDSGVHSWKDGMTGLDMWSWWWD